MSLLRPSIAGRVLRAGAPITRRNVRGTIRFDSTASQRTGAEDTPTTTLSTPLASSGKPGQSMSDVKENQPKHNQPNYSAEVDQASSTFSPVPKHVLNGSEDTDVLPAAVLSGAPIELSARTVRIYKPAKTATQSGDWHGHHWRMDWDILPKGHRWENPLMGWQSTADFMQGLHMTFKSKEDAVKFAEKQGYEYFVQEPNYRKIVPKLYANNFLWSAKKLKHIRTK